MRWGSWHVRILAVIITFALILSLPVIAGAQPRSLYVPAILGTGHSDGTISLVNSGVVAATVTLIGRGYDGMILRGSRVNPITMNVPPQNSTIVRAKDLFGEGTTAGWIEVQTNSTAITGSFLYVDPSLPAEEGAELISSAESQLIFPKITADRSAANCITVVNTSNHRLNQIGVTLFDNSGTPITNRNIALSAYSGWRGTISDLFPELASFDGYAVVDAKSNSGPEALIGFETYVGRTDFAALPAISLSSSLETGYVAHFVSQAGYTSTVNLVNYGNSKETVSITVGGLEYAGRPAAFSTQTEEVLLDANQRQEIPLDQLFGFSGSAMISGFVRIQTQDDSTGIFGYMELKTSGGRVAAVPLQGAGYLSSTLSYSPDGNSGYTAVAFQNPGFQPSNVRIYAFDSRGYVVGSTSLTLGAGVHWSRTLHDMMPTLANQGAGSLRIIASTPILASEMVGSTTAAGSLAIIPAQGSPTESQFAPPVIALNGGNITSADGTATLTIPAGAMIQDATIRVRALNVEDFPNPPENQKLVGMVQGTPDGMHFRNPISLKFPLSEPVPPGTILKVFVFNPATHEYDPSEFFATVDPSGRSALTDVTHFTIFAVCIPQGLQIMKINPTTAGVGDNLMIYGSGFAPSPEENTIYFTGGDGGIVSTQVNTASAEALSVTVPLGTASGKVYAQVADLKSNAIRFNLSGSVNQTHPVDSGPNQPLASNAAPVVLMGTYQVITLPATASLSATVTDDGLPAGSSVSLSWTKVSGPGTVTFGNAASASTMASFSVAGTYILRLTANDTDQSSASDVVITVNAAVPVNKAPVVNTGTNQTVTLPATASLSATVSDDGLPAGSSISVSWTKLSGPGTVTFGNSANTSTAASFSTAGTYVLRLTASDGALSSTSDLTVTVNSASTGNQPPVVSAGPNQTILFPFAAIMAGTATDDGLPGGNLSVSWAKVSGPATIVFSNANSLNAVASFLSAGTYVLRLTVSDGALTSTSDMTVIVNSCGNVVNGNAQIVANATDDVGVTGLQFKLDGVNLASNFTSPPYSLTWNTLTTTNGCHVVTAIAVDAAGNQGIATYNVTVYNP